jgi:acyl dehydratase
MSRYLEDLQSGAVFKSPPRTITAKEIVEFARAYDPQPAHVDPEAAKNGFFLELVASGWHTAALTMRMMCDSGIDIAGGIIGAGMEHLHWPVPLRPNDTIHVHMEVLQSRASKSRPQIGIVQLSVHTLRADGVAVQEMLSNLVVPRSPAVLRAENDGRG